MKEFFNALKCGIIFQLISWGSFLLYDETGIMNEGYAMVFGVITLIGILIYYLFNAHKYLKKQKFNSLIFNITLFIFWVAASIGMSYLFLFLIDMKVLHVCNGEGWSCFLNGIEYFVHGLFMVILGIILVFIEIIIWLYKLIKNKTFKNVKNKA